MSFDETMVRVGRFVESLHSAGAELPNPSLAAAADPALAGKLPGWIARYGALTDGRNAWIYCEPHPGPEPGLAGQILLHTPDGRFLVDSFDAATATCIARESAGGTPLVVGLPFGRADSSLDSPHWLNLSRGSMEPGNPWLVAGTFSSILRVSWLACAERMKG